MKSRRRRSSVEPSSFIWTSGPEYLRARTRIEEDDFVSVEAMGELAYWLHTRRLGTPSREAIYESFALAYAIWLADSQSGLFMRCYHAMPDYLRAGGNGFMLINPSFDPDKPQPVKLHDFLAKPSKRPYAGPEPFLELTMVYPPASRDPKEMHRRIRQISRDARAMHHLVEREITPAEVVSLSRQKGESLDAWSRRALKRGSMAQALPTVSAAATRVYKAKVSIHDPRNEAATSWHIWDQELAARLRDQLDDWVEERPSAISKC